MSPPGDDVRVRIKVSHPDYVDDQAWGESQDQQGITMTTLREQTAALEMRRGVAVSGTVTTPEGEPVNGAVVIWSDRPNLQSGSQEVHTDERGVYRFPPLSPGRMKVTVVAEGWMPAMRTVEITPGMSPVDFPLQPGRSAIIKFVDQKGAPVPDVYVGISRWRGAKSLYNRKDSSVLDTKIPNRADENGIFRWNWAPDDTVRYSFSKPGFAAGSTNLAADDTEHVRTINPLLRLEGTVTDAVTGKPIEEFEVVPVIYFNPEFGFLWRDSRQRHTGGEFSIEFDGTYRQHAIQIEALGYKVARTGEVYRIGDPNPDLEFRLEPTERHTGRVVDEAGNAVAGASIYVATALQQLDLRFEELDPIDDRNDRVIADANGAFEIVPQIDRYTVVAVSENGYTEAEHQPGEPPGELRLRPWARVTGRLVQDGHGVGGWHVNVDPIRSHGGDSPRVDLRLVARTAADGSFAFNRVPPLPCRVAGFLHWSVDSPLASSRSVPLDLVPGENADISLGDTGIEITGRLAVESAPDDFEYQFSLTYLLAKRPGIKPPAFLANAGFDWRQGWSDAIRSSTEGAVFRQTLHHHYVKPTPDGHFRISGVEAGEYDLAINLYGSTEGCLVHPVATRVIPVRVEQDASSLDLGTISMPSLRLPEVGDSAPDFTFVEPDGRESELASLRGKYVLLDFWATWCAPCVSKLDDVERLRQRHEDQDGFVVLGLNLDADQEQAKAFLDRKNLPWRHALLGEWSSTDVPRRFAVASLPTYVLIDPDGQIVARGASLEPVADKLDSLLETAAQP